MLHRGFMVIYCLIWNNQLRPNIDFVRIFFRIFLRIWFTFTYLVHHFRKDSYKRRAYVIVMYESVVMLFLRWRWVTRNRTVRWKSPHIRSIKEVPVFSRSSTIWTKINARLSYASRTKNLFAVFVNVFLIQSKETSHFRVTIRKKSVKQIQNAATAHRGKIGRKESYWCSEADFYLILSILSLITEGIKR